MSNVQQRTNTLALVGFILSFFMGPIGSLLCYFGLEEIKKNGEQGREFAVAGIIIGIVPIAIALFVLLVYVFVIIWLLIISLLGILFMI